MPVYEVTDPTTGKTLELEGDSPPSEQELEQIFATQNEPDFLGAGVIEPAIAMGSGIESAIRGGLAGTVQALNPMAEQGAGAKAVEDIQSGAYRPKTQAGKQGLKTIGDVFQKGVDLANIPLSGLAGIAEIVAGQGLDQAADTVSDVQDKGLSETLGDRTLEETNSPLAATVAHTFPAAVGSVFGLKGADKALNATKGAATAAADATKEVAKNIFAYQSPTKQKIVELIEEGSPHIDTAKFKLVNGRAVKDQLSLDAIKQGFDEGVIAALKGSSSTDKVKMQRMVSIMQKGKKNARFAIINRPADVAGETLLERVKFIRDTNRQAGTDIDKAAQSLKGQSVDLSLPVSNFSEALDSLGISIKRNDKGDFLPDFSKSEVSPGDRGPIREVIRQMSVKSQGGNLDAFTVHKMKRIIDRNVTFGKVKTGISGDAERALKQFRSGLDEALDSNFPDYNAANIKYAETINALDSIQSAAGRKLDFSSASADKATGTVLRRLMSNTQSRANFIDAINEVETVVKKNGGRFDDDLLNQVIFADELDRVFGPVAKTSLQGQVDQSIGRKARGLATREGREKLAADAVEKAAKSAGGTSQDRAFESIMRILRESE